MRINKRSARVFSGKPVTESSGIESSRIHKEQFLNHVAWNQMYASLFFVIPQ